ncbi:MAG TPA: hypothetical protein VKF82_02425 [Candidatus Eremiobacteraceae bacterium]|nr:hypothetical protein [Candidatus Eremiobacteraceae bacterium]
MALGFLAGGCSSSSSTPAPPAAPPHLYVTDSTGTLYAYTLPLTATSTPAVTVAAKTCVCQNAVFGGELVSGLYVLTLPLTTTSTPAKTLTVTSSPIGAAIDSTGTIYLSENMSATCCADVYQGGVTSPSFTLSGASVNDPYGAAVDTGNNLFLANVGTIGYFASPVHSGQAGIAFGRDSFNEGLVTDSSDNLYVADGNGKGTMDVYHPPYTAASMPASTVSIPGTLEQMAIGSDGTMYITVETPNQIDVLTPPYTTVSLVVPTTFLPYGVASGQ